MAHRPGGKIILDNLELIRKPEVSLRNVISGSDKRYNDQTGLFLLDEFVFNNSEITVIDGGEGNGGWVGLKLADVNGTQYCAIAGSIEIEVHSTGPGIVQDGFITFGFGYDEADDASPTGPQADLAANLTVPLTDGAGGPSRAAGPILPKFVTVATFPSMWLNLAVIDANIDEDAVVTFSGHLHVYRLDLS